MKKSIFIFFLLFAFTSLMSAQININKEYLPEIHGTVRAKYEYEPPIDKGRFEIRNARLSVEGKVISIARYKAEIDLSDEGKIKMLDAYVRIQPKDWKFTVGQMRVPFTIDAHRSPHLQFFANRSFIAKQVGNVRDVGASVSWTSRWSTPVTLEGGIFNGSGLTDQKDFWTSKYNFSFKAQTLIAEHFNVTLSCQKANAGDAFAAYRLPLKKGFTSISFLGRYDYMSNHSKGNKDAEGKLKIDDPERHRLTGGITLSLGTAKLQSDIRLNYEQYIYKKDIVPSISEQNKIVLELVAHF